MLSHLGGYEGNKTNKEEVITVKAKMNPAMMTNRELYTAYQECKTEKKSADQYSILQEMAKRINRKMITSDVISIFSQYKLNGAGDQRY